MKRQATNWKNVFAHYISGRESIGVEYIKNSQNSAKENSPFRK